MARSPFRRGRWLLFVLPAFLGHAPAPLGAYEIFGVRWPNNRASFSINPNFPDAALSGSREQQIDILRCAAAVWRDQSPASFEFIYSGTTTRSGFNTSDGVNTVSWVNADSPDALAATIIDGFGSRMTAFDIVFFDRTGGSKNNWNGPRDPQSGTYDISGIAVHEFGHALGLDHSSVQQATMFASAQGRGLPLRTLHQDDIDGVVFLYGRRDGFSPLPMILAVEPGNGPTSGGNEVMITGKNFTWTADSVLRLGGTSLSRTFWDVESCGHIRVRSMPARPTGPINVALTNSLGEHLLAAGYRYGTAAPRLLAIEPASGPTAGGIQITITGSDLTGEAVVSIGGNPLVEPRLIDSTTLTGTLPAASAPGKVDVRLAQGLDTALLSEAFEYLLLLQEAVLRLDSAKAVPGALRAPVPVRVTNDLPLNGISFGFVFDTSAIRIDDVTVEGTIAENASFAAATIDNELGEATFGLVMDLRGTSPTIPAGADQEIATVLASVAAEALPGTEVLLEIRDPVGTSIPPIEVFFTPAGSSLGQKPLVVNGTLTIIDGVRFIRGDANGDGRTDISDSIYLLEYLFRGGPAPPCPDAGDINDDGQLDLSDPVYLLLYLFQSSRAPPPPHPEPGFDPTLDSLECE
jgi:hypothetical protein